MASPFVDLANGFINLCLTLRLLGNKTRYGAAMARDDEGCAALHVIEELGQMGFRFRCLDGSHNFDQSFRLVQF